MENNIQSNQRSVIEQQTPIDEQERSDQTTRDLNTKMVNTSNDVELMTNILVCNLYVFLFNYQC